MAVDKEDVTEKATYQKIKDYVRQKYAFNVHIKYIAEVKRKHGLSIHKASNKVDVLNMKKVIGILSAIVIIETIFLLVFFMDKHGNGKTDAQTKARVKTNSEAEAAPSNDFPYFVMTRDEDELAAYKQALKDNPIDAKYNEIMEKAPPLHLQSFLAAQLEIWEKKLGKSLDSFKR